MRRSIVRDRGGSFLIILLIMAIAAVLALVFLPKSFFKKKAKESAATQTASPPAARATEPTATASHAAGQPEAAAARRQAAGPGGTSPKPEKTGKKVQTEERTLRCELAHVRNGNTFVGYLRGKHQTIRLLYVDAPEAGKAGYAEAKKALEDMLRGADLRLEFDGEQMRDSDSRLLAYAVASGKIVNAELVRRGLAVHWQPVAGSRFASELEAAERDARSARRGIWGYFKVMTQQMKRHVALTVASDGSNRVTLADGRTVRMRNFISVPLNRVERSELEDLLGLGEGRKILSQMSGE